MDIRSVLRVLGALLVFCSLTLILPIGVSLYYQDGDFHALLFSLLVSVTLGGLLWKLLPSEGELRIREGFAIVTFGWLLLTLFGTLPYLFSDVEISFTDAFFETMSGFTTTGATILTDVESLPHGILFWRSLTHWLGGMGIILLSLAILPMLSVGGMQLFKAEVPGPSVDKFQPRIQDTAKSLWGVYVIITMVEAGLLKLGGMNIFDALCHTFGTVATGGFSTKSAGIGHFESAYIEYVITFFMIVAGTNFALHYRAFQGQFRNYLDNSEWRFYLGLVGVVTGFIFVDLFFFKHGGIFYSFQKSIFQVTSLMTTTGFHSANYETWSTSSQLVLVSLMFIGGCAGSTGGSIKVVRIYILFRYGLTQLKKLLHPQAVIPIRLSNRSVPSEAITEILGFVLLYILIFAIASIFMSTLGLDLVTSVSTVISTLGNIGPGVGTIGPTENYAHIPLIGKWMLSFLMLTGRLEIYTVLVIFNRYFWTK
ncbi:TrkH family potassium uptake protein [candidate division KSB1 bacterium]|nr:TrkH family potassium uptake protein [candidate division KSB1 bacterium]NIR72632.1 TrkH family potassium uptake protein [candidate division KSB1 bacterium]NIS27343.1 TrkH family potassium uptake protein [candidate division KSB1 bacterium]NIT73556.1 TrkH family potassium uptake protein [candidate division KSB1 bacterium]NIU25404.1 TrkH family potassium uptake protein [candidate division KSB1 bacterium]